MIMCGLVSTHMHMYVRTYTYVCMYVCEHMCVSCATAAKRNIVYCDNVYVHTLTNVRTYVRMYVRMYLVLVKSTFFQ
jgi:hypothetical protein